MPTGEAFESAHAWSFGWATGEGWPIGRMWTPPPPSARRSRSLATDRRRRGNGSLWTETKTRLAERRPKRGFPRRALLEERRVSPAVPLSSLMVLDMSRLLPAPCRTSILGDLGSRVIKVEAPGTGTESARRSRPGRVGKSKWFSRSIWRKTRSGSRS